MQIVEPAWGECHAVLGSVADPYHFDTDPDPGS